MEIKSKIYNYSVYYVLICLFVFAIPFKVNYGNLTLIIVAIYSLFFISKGSIFKSHFFYFPLLFFLITIINSLAHKNSLLGLKRTDLEFLPIMVLLVLVNLQMNVKRFEKLLFVFYSSTFFFTLILVAISIYNRCFNINSGTFHYFTHAYDQHPVYFSLYISLSLCYLLIYQKEIKFKRHLLFKIITALILVFGLVLSSSKAVLIFNFALLFIYVFIRYKKVKEKLLGFLFILVFGLLIYNTSNIKERLTNGLTMSSEILTFKPTNDFSKKKIFTYNEKKDISDLELRYLFAKIAIYHAYKDGKLFFGYGQANVQNYLDYYYYSYNLGPNWYEGYNVHNQYLHIVITYGILVLAIFLIYLYISFRVAIINCDYLYLLFLLICSFVFLFEVVLVRNKGIIFFYFFNTLFLTQHLKFEDSNTRNKRNTKFSWWI